MVCDKVVCERWCQRWCVTKWQQLLQKALCTAPATRQPAAAQRRPRAQQLRREALCTAPPHDSQPSPAATTRARRRGPAATTRAAASAAPPGGSVYCACHTTASRGPAVTTRSSSSAWRLCVLRLPHDS